MWAIIKKEVKTYFLSPIGYIFIGIFLAMCSIFFYLEVYYYGTTDFSYMFYSVATILTFIVPILTMRTFSEEKKNGTDQLLLTAPVRTTTIVLAKFIAVMTIVFIAEILTAIYFVILMCFGTPYIMTALVTLLGFFLLSMAYVSFGIFASSLTENQIIAAVITMALFIAIWFMPQFIPSLSSFSLINMFTQSFPLGTISIPAIVLFVTFTITCTLLTMIVVQRKKGVK